MSEIEPGKKWQIATVTSVRKESPRVKLFALNLVETTPHRAGQYYDIRLTAPDGYQTQRSYSVSSSVVHSDSIELAIELINDGEVSSYFHDVVSSGDQIEVRGPIGGHFTLSPNYSKPVLLIAGGSGIAPIMSMIRSRRDAANASPTALLFSFRTEADFLFRSELVDQVRTNVGFHLLPVVTRTAPRENSSGILSFGRINRDSILSAIVSLTGNAGSPASGYPQSLPARAYVCGGSGFVEAMGNHLLDIGMGLHDIRTERFGP